MRRPKYNCLEQTLQVFLHIHCLANGKMKITNFPGALWQFCIHIRCLVSGQKQENSGQKRKTTCTCAEKSAEQFWVKQRNNGACTEKLAEQCWIDWGCGEVGTTSSLFKNKKANFILSNLTLFSLFWDTKHFPLMLEDFKNTILASNGQNNTSLLHFWSFFDSLFFIQLLCGMASADLKKKKKIKSVNVLMIR